MSSPRSCSAVIPSARRSWRSAVTTTRFLTCHAEYQRAWRGRLVDIIARCAGCEPDHGDLDRRILLETVRDTAARELAAADSRVYDFSVTTFPLGGPSLMLLIASRTQVGDADSATAYLTRCRRIPAYLDQHAARLQAAARDGLMPVAPLVSDVIGQLKDHLSHPERDPMLTHRPPEGWAGAAAWRDEVERVIRDEVRPAVGRYADLLAELLPRSRPPEQAGLLYLPGGVSAYASCVRNGTTLPFDPDELHRLGLAALAEIEEQIGRARPPGAGYRGRRRHHGPVPQGPCAGGSGRRGRDGARRRRDRPRPGAAAGYVPLTAAAAVRCRAHATAHGQVRRATVLLAACSGRLAPGAYLFNDVQPGQAGSWALEATAFHEGVPGHHAQFARVQLLPHLPLLLAGFYVVPHGEGWGLYAERLADEFGLYSDDMQRLGMLGCAAWRAVRLVVDSGLHARGWSRARAREFALAHSPMPEDFVDAEMDRYIALPGQALGYLVGQREILRLRDEARSRLGAAFDIRDFHSAILDHGSLPLPVLGQVVADWAAAQQTVPRGRR